MGRYTLRRLLQLIPVLLGTTFLIYWLVWSLPGDPFAGKCGDRGCPESYITQMTEKYHIPQKTGSFVGDTKELFEGYFFSIGNMLRGDFGVDFRGREVVEIMANAWPITLRLALLALTFEALIGITAGVLTGLRRGKFLDNLTLVSTLVLISIPIFVIGFVVQFGGIKAGIKEGIGRPTVTSDAPWAELVLPALVLASAQLAYMARLSRTSLVENLRADYVRTAVAKGLTRSRVVGVHLLRNSMIPVVTLLGLDLGALMGGAIITEGIFNIRGVGGTLFGAISRYDSTVVVPMVTVLVLVYLLMNLLVDLLYGVLDPRIRYE